MERGNKKEEEEERDEKVGASLRSQEGARRDKEKRRLKRARDEEKEAVTGSH